MSHKCWLPWLQLSSPLPSTLPTDPWGTGSQEVTPMSREPSFPSFCLSRKPEKPEWPGSVARGSRWKGKEAQRPRALHGPSKPRGLVPSISRTLSPHLCYSPNNISNNPSSGEGPLRRACLKDQPPFLTAIRGSQFWGVPGREFWGGSVAPSPVLPYP